MRTYAALVLTAILAVDDAASQMPPLPECPIQSNVSTVLSELKMGIIFGNVHMSDELQKKLKDAAYADAMACQDVVDGMHNWVDESLRMQEENLRLLKEINDLKLENTLLQNRIEKTELNPQY